MEKTKQYGIFTTDKEFKVTSWNPWLEIVTGIAASTIQGKNLFEIFPEIEKRNLKKYFEKVVNTGNVEILSAAFHKYLIKCSPLYNSKVFSEMQQSVKISPLLDGTTVIGTITTIEDITKVVEQSQGSQISEIDKDSSQTDQSTLLTELGDNNWQVRRNAIAQLSKSNYNYIEDVVLKIKNEHKNLNILSSAIQVLLKSQDEITDALCDLIHSEDDDIRIYAAQTMGERYNERFITELINALDDKNENVVYHAIESLGKLKAISAVDRLIDIAIKQNFFTSFPAIDALKNIGDASTVQKLFPLLDNEIFSSVVIETLGSIGDEKVIPALMKLFNSNSNIIQTISKAIYNIYRKYEDTYSEGEIIIDLFRKHINEIGIKNILSVTNKMSSYDLRDIIRVLGWLRGSKIGETLSSLIKNDQLRDTVVESLILLGKDATEYLIEQLKTDDRNVKGAIIVALGRICDNRTVESLINLIPELEDDEELMVLVLGSLAKIGDRAAFEPLLQLIGHPNHSVRRAAISALNSIGHPKMEIRISQLLNDPNPNIRESAVRIAGYFGYQRCKNQVIRCCLDEEEAVRAAALENLPFFEEDRILFVLKEAIKQDTIKCRIAAVKALAFVEDKNVFNILLDCLEEKEPWVKINAIRSLVFHRYHEAMEKFIELAEKENSIPVKIAALEAIGEIGGALAVSVLSKYTDHENDDISYLAIKALGKVNHPNAIQPLIYLLKSPNPKKRIEALKSLSNSQDESVVKQIQWVAATDKDFDVRKEATYSLRAIESQESINALINLTADKELREVVIKLLSNLPIQKLYMLHSGISNFNSTVKTATLEILSRMKNTDATEMIASCLDDADPFIRYAALGYIGKIGTREYIKKIAYMANNDNDTMVKKSAKDLLESLK